MQLLEKIREKARKRNRRIALPEVEDVRILRAAQEAAALKVAKIVLVGDEEKAKAAAKANSVKLDGIEIINPLKSKNLDKFANEFFQIRKHKGITEAEALATAKNPLFYTALMTRFGDVDGFVAGTVETSANVARAGIYCVGVDKSAGTLSSAFAIVIEGCKYGEEGGFVFSDCAVVPDPSPRQLAGIAYSSGNLFRFLFEKEPIVALLSYSTKGSASGPMVDKVVEAVRIAKELYPNLKLDGEMQVDAAVDAGVAKKKCPDSPVGGKANVLIFPDINSGNIAYKIVDRLAQDSKAIGPLLQGLAKPCSDLSRGCKWEDIVDAIAITAVRDK